MRPTDLAKLNFQAAQEFTKRAIDATGDFNVRDTYQVDMALAIQALSIGMEQMATGLRATYMFLEDVNQKLDKTTRPLVGQGGRLIP